MDPTLPNPAVGGYRGADRLRGRRARTAATAEPRSTTYHGAVGPRLGVAYSLNDRTVLRAAYGINYSRRGAVGGRAGARNGTGTLGFSANASFPSPNGFDPAYNWNNGVPSYSGAAVLRSVAQRRLRRGPWNGRRRDLWRSRDRRTAAALPELECRLSVRARAHDHRRRHIRREPRRLPRRQRARLLRESARSAVPRPRQPADPAGDARQHRRRAGNRVRRRAAVPEFLRHHRADAAAVPAGTRASPTCTATSRGPTTTRCSSRSRSAGPKRPDGEFQLHVQPHRGQSRRADRLQLRSGLGRRRQRSAARLERDGRLQHAVWRATGKPGSGNASCARSSRTGRSPASRSSDRAVRSGSIGAACNLPNAGTCYADFNPNFTGDVRINGDYGDGDVLGANPPSYIDRAAFQSPARSPTGTRRGRSRFDLRNPNYFNQDLSVRRDFRIVAG